MYQLGLIFFWVNLMAFLCLSTSSLSTVTSINTESFLRATYDFLSQSMERKPLGWVSVQQTRKSVLTRRKPWCSWGARQVTLSLYQIGSYVTKSGNSLRSWFQYAWSYEIALHFPHLTSSPLVNRYFLQPSTRQQLSTFASQTPKSSGQTLNLENPATNGFISSGPF